MNWTPATVVIALLLVGYAVWLGIVARWRLAAPELRSMSFTDRLRRLGLGIFLLPVVTALAGHWDAIATLVPLLVAPAVALAFWTFAPRYVSSKVVPLALVADGLYGFVKLRDYLRAYGTDGTWHPQFLLFEAWVLLAVGLWWTWRVTDQNSKVARLVLREKGQVPSQRGRLRWGLILLMVLALVVELLGPRFWLGIPWWGVDQTLAVTAAAVFLVIRAPKTAGNLALAGLILFGLYGIALSVFWPYSVPLPSPYNDVVRYGLILVDNRGPAIGAGLEGLALTGFGLWLVPRAIDDRTRALFRSASDADLARRVTRLTRTRADAVDSATTQLRRLERDLHDGAQARLVALGMSLRAAERLIPTSPQAAIELVAEARETSVKVLDELRHLVRGICPPVLADRGLADAVRALALDAPLRTEVEVDLSGRPDLAVETACYFAVAEALTNAVKHSGARQAQIKIWHADGSLRINVIDDGCGGANPAAGSGLRGLERRLGTFDGVLAVNSPAGGPTIIAIEVPCALSSPKISSFSGTA
ncbi:MAG TPA: histidine kinase [Streptosporangiaceae bacterium]|nr:histidine kinase [Streptosporangiaceae bacterium]